MDGILM